MLVKKSDGKPKGKLVVLHNHRDGALAASSWVINWERRLGQNGTGTKNHWFGYKYDPNLLLEKFKDCHVNEDCNSLTGLFQDMGGHSYQFDEKAIAIYDKHALLS